jgi:hypothetical protein
MLAQYVHCLVYLAENRYSETNVMHF